MDDRSGRLPDGCQSFTSEQFRLSLLERAAHLLESACQFAQFPVSIGFNFIIVIPAAVFARPNHQCLHRLRYPAGNQEADDEGDANA